MRRTTKRVTENKAPAGVRLVGDFIKLSGGPFDTKTMKMIDTINGKKWW